MPYAAGSSANRKEASEGSSRKCFPFNSLPHLRNGLHLASTPATALQRHRAALPRRARHISPTFRGDMGTLRATGFCALLAAVLATSASAQQAQTRQGFWIGGGMGYG